MVIAVQTREAGDERRKLLQGFPPALAYVKWNMMLGVTETQG